MKLADMQYVVLFEGDEKPEPIGSFEIKGNSITILNDPNGMLSELLPSGELTPAHKHRLMSLMRSGYYAIVPANRFTE